MKATPDSFPFPFLRPYHSGEVLLAPRPDLSKKFEAFLEQPDRPVVCLLSGTPNTGKTSWVRAALPALLGAESRVLHLEAEKVTELRQSIQEAVEGDAFVDLPTLWQQAEADGQALWVVLDAVEEEHGFWAEIRQLDFQPKGGLVLVMDSGRFLSARALLDDTPFFAIPFSPIPKEAVSAGLRQWVEQWQETYGITLENGLPEMLGAEVAESQHEDPLFALQLIVLRFWERTIGAEVPRPVWSISMFKKIRSEGLTPTDFARNQWVRLKEAHPEAAASGALAEVMGKLAQGQTKTHKELRKDFSELDPPYTDFLQTAASCYLLREDSAETLHWLHPDFPGVFAQIQRRADRPAQVARRLLEAKMQSLPPLRFNKDELELLEATRRQMRKRSTAEELHITESQKQLKKQRGGARGWKWSTYFLLLLTLLLGAGLYLQWQDYEEERSRARSESQQLRTDFLAFITEKVYEEDPTRAVRLAESNDEIEPLAPSARRALYKAFLNPQPYRTGSQNAQNIRQEKLRGTHLAYLSEGGKAVIQDVNGTLVRTYEKETATALELTETHTLLGTKDGQILLFPKGKDEPEKRINAHQQAVVRLAADTTGHLLSVSLDGELKVWRLSDGTQQAIAPTNLPFPASSLSYTDFHHPQGALLQNDSLLLLWQPGDSLPNPLLRLQAKQARFHPRGVLLQDSLGWAVRKDSTTLYRPESWKNVRYLEPLSDSSELLVFDNNLVQFSDGQVLQTEGRQVENLWVSAKRIVLADAGGNFLFFNREGQLLGSFESVPSERHLLSGTAFVLLEGSRWRSLTLADKAVCAWSAQEKIAFAPDGKSYVVFEPDSLSLHAYRLPSHEKLRSIRLSGLQSVSTLQPQFLPNSRHVLLGNTLSWDTQTGQLLQTETPVQFSDTGNLHLSLQEDGKFFLNDSAGVPVAVLYAESAQFMPQKDQLWTYGDEQLTLWNHKGDTLLKLEGKITDFVLSPDGTHLITTPNRKDFTLYELSGGELRTLRKYQLSVAATALIAPQSGHVLFRHYRPDPTARHELIAWFVGDEQRRPPKNYLRGNLLDLRPTADGRYVLAANATHVDFFDWQGERRGSVAGRFVQYLPKENLIVTLRPNQFLLGDAFYPGTLLSHEVSGLRTLRFSPDGNWLSFNQNGRLQLLPISPISIRDWLDTHQVLQLTAEDRRQFMLD